MRLVLRQRSEHAVEPRHPKPAAPRPRVNTRKYSSCSSSRERSPRWCSGGSPPALRCRESLNCSLLVAQVHLQLLNPHRIAVGAILAQQQDTASSSSLAARSSPRCPAAATRPRPYRYSGTAALAGPCRPPATAAASSAPPCPDRHELQTVIVKRRLEQVHLLDKPVLLVPVPRQLEHRPDVLGPLAVEQVLRAQRRQVLCARHDVQGTPRRGRLIEDPLALLLSHILRHADSSPAVNI